MIVCHDSSSSLLAVRTVGLAGSWVGAWMLTPPPPGWVARSWWLSPAVVAFRRSWPLTGPSREESAIQAATKQLAALAGNPPSRPLPPRSTTSLPDFLRHLSAPSPSRQDTKGSQNPRKSSEIPPRDPANRTENTTYFSARHNKKKTTSAYFIPKVQFNGRRQLGHAVETLRSRE